MQYHFFPDEQQNLQLQCGDTDVHIEGRKVKQKDFHFSELHTLQCTVMLPYAILKGLFKQCLVTGTQQCLGS